LWKNQSRTVGGGLTKKKEALLTGKGRKAKKNELMPPQIKRPPSNTGRKGHGGWWDQQKHQPLPHGVLVAGKERSDTHRRGAKRGDERKVLPPQYDPQYIRKRWQAGAGLFVFKWSLLNPPCHPGRARVAKYVKWGSLNGMCLNG